MTQTYKSLQTESFKSLTNEDLDESKERIIIVDRRIKNEKIKKALQLLCEGIMSEEELKIALKYDDGESLKAIDEIVWNLMKIKNQQEIINDSLYSQRLLEIENITDMQLKAKKILLYACMYASEHKNDLFIDLMERYGRNKQINFEIQFDYYDRKMDLLRHLVYTSGVNNMKCVRYLLESEIIKVHDQQVTDALNFAIKIQNEEATEFLMSVKNLDAKERREKEYALNYLKEKEKSELMLLYLKKHFSQNNDEKEENKKYEEVMQALCESTLTMIKDKKLISSQVFNMCWIYDKKKMWDCIFQNYREMLNIDNQIHDNSYQWQWIVQHLINNRDLLCWLDRYDEENNQKLRYEEIKNLCDISNKMEMERNAQKLKQEMEKNEESMNKLIEWTYDKIDPQYKNQENWRQDKIKYGLKSQKTFNKLLQTQMKSNDKSFYPKHIYDHEVYLNELWIRAHSMEASFQQEMKKIFVETGNSTCVLKNLPIKSHDRCIMKVQEKYADCAFPKSAHIIDILGCQVIYETFEHLKQGLDNFIACVEQKSDVYQIIRVKNGFNRNTKFKSQQSNIIKNEKDMYTTQLKLPIPQEYQDIRINLIYTNNYNSIITEVHLSVKTMLTIKQRQHPLHKISRLYDFMLASSKQIAINSFDMQLQMAGFHPQALAPLMLYHPLQFKSSRYILHDKDEYGQNFLCRMAYSNHLQYQCAKQLVQSGDFIPLQIVQEQLMECGMERIYALMWALWKQSSMECMELFVPTRLSDSTKVWSALNRNNMSCIDFASRNIMVDVVVLLTWLKKNIDDESEWQRLLQIQDTSVGMSPLMEAVLHQSKLNGDVMELLTPKGYQTHYEFWEMTCTRKMDRMTLLHLVFRNGLPNVLNRLEILKKYIPDVSWERMLHTTHEYGCTPLMCAMWFSSEMNEKIISLLVPKRTDVDFWRTIVNDKAYRTQGCNVLHLAIMTDQSDVLPRLRCLRAQMGEDMWQELSQTRNKTLLKENAIEMARRLKRSQQVMNELLPLSSPKQIIS